MKQPPASANAYTFPFPQCWIEFISCYDVLAVMEVRLEHPRFYDSFVEAVQSNSNIVDCYYLTGDFDFNLKICCRSSEELEDLHRFVKEIPGVSGTITHYVLKEVKNIYEVSPTGTDEAI